MVKMVMLVRTNRDRFNKTNIPSIYHLPNPKFISLATVVCLAAIFRRRYAVSLLELMAEMALIQKANPIHDLLHAEKRSAEQSFRLS